MKILLINPSQANVYGARMTPPYPSLGLLYITAVLEKENHKIELIDFDVDIDKFEDFKSLIEHNSYDLIGFYSVTPTINHVFYLAEIIKGINKKIPFQ